MGEFSNRTALVTGAGRNIGRAIALAFADGGANVGIIVKTNRAEAEAVADEVRSRGVRAAVCVGNIGDADTDAAMVAEIVKALGPISYLVTQRGLPSAPKFPRDFQRRLGSHHRFKSIVGVLSVASGSAVYDRAGFSAGSSISAGPTVHGASSIAPIM